MSDKIILAADLHLTAETPICRTDDYVETQFRKLNFLIETANELCADIYIAGDIFDRSREPRWFEITVINIFEELRKNLGIITIPGNHDLPNHNIGKLYDSSLGILLHAIKNFIIYETPLETIAEINSSEGMIHQMIHKDKRIHENVKSKKAIKLLKECSKLDLITTGDNHKTFTEEYEGRLLVNPGSMMRKTADQFDHKPCFFIYDRKTKKLEQVFFPIESAKKVMTREHLEKQEAKDQRFENFIKHVRDGYEITFSLDKNFENYFKKNKTRKSVKEIIMEELWW